VSDTELWEGWRAAWSGRDARAFAAVCAPALHYEDPLTEQPLKDVGELGEHARRLWNAFPDARLEETGAVVADARHAAIPGRLRGTNRGPLGALPATGRPLAAHVVFYAELERGRLMRVRAFYDLYDAAAQLGILPARGTLGERALLALRGYGLRRGASR